MLEGSWASGQEALVGPRQTPRGKIVDTMALPSSMGLHTVDNLVLPNIRRLV
jgi:hypothetical protein